MEEKGQNISNEEQFSKAVRAGKRTYFFDVRSTRSGDNYLTITESKKRFDQKTGKFYYEKHKVFLYKEDFEKFKNALEQAIEYIRTGEFPQEYLDEKEEEERRKQEKEKEKTFTDIQFEDLDNTGSKDSDGSGK